MKQYLPIKKLNKNGKIALGVVAAVFALFAFEIYLPTNPFSGSSVTYVVQKGEGADQIASELAKLGLIHSSAFFKSYLALSFKYPDLQAGKYLFSPRMSAYQIASKLANGDVVKNTLVIKEGWTINDIGNYVASKNICTKDQFVTLANQDWSSSFDFLKDKPKNLSLEGYLFPDTYELADGDNCQDFIGLMLSNFGKKLTPSMRTQISKEKKSIFDTVIMASLLEKEVKTLSDKEMVAGILNNRLSIGMPLQLDATVNYVTGRSDPSVAIKDTKVDSPYNTYKYPGLPKGPISNPGLASLTAAINPKPNDYLYYLSDGITHFAKTLQEQIANKQKYLD